MKFGLGRLYYGWVMLPVAMLGLIATSPGQTFGISVFTEPMRKSIGVSHGQFAAAYMLGTLLAALPIAWIGGMMDRFGLKRTLTAAVLLFGSACLITSQAAGWLSLFGSFFLLRLLGPGALAFLSSNTLAFWFHRRLGTAEGIRQVGMAGAMAVIPLLNIWLLNQFGWRGSYVVLGTGVWVLMLPLIVFCFRNHPEEVGQVIDGGPAAPGDKPALEAKGGECERSFTVREAMGSRSFWIVMAGTALFGIIHTAVFFSIVPLFLDRGLTEADAARMLTVFAISLAGSQFVGGVLADRVPANAILPIAVGGLGGSCWLLANASERWVADVSGVVMGISQGFFFAASTPLWARYFGRLHLGKIRGWLVTVNVASSSVGPLLFGAARDAFGSYDSLLLGFAFLPLPVMVASLFATPPSPKDTKRRIYATQLRAR